MGMGAIFKKQARVGVFGTLSFSLLANSAFAQTRGLLLPGGTADKTLHGVSRVGEEKVGSDDCFRTLDAQSWELIQQAHDLNLKVLRGEIKDAKKAQEEIKNKLKVVGNNNLQREGLLSFLLSATAGDAAENLALTLQARAAKGEVPLKLTEAEKNALASLQNELKQRMDTGKLSKDEQAETVPLMADPAAYLAKLGHDLPERKAAFEVLDRHHVNATLNGWEPSNTDIKEAVQDPKFLDAMEVFTPGFKADFEAHKTEIFDPNRKAPVRIGGFVIAKQYPPNANGGFSLMTSAQYMEELSNTYDRFEKHFQENLRAGQASSDVIDFMHNSVKKSFSSFAEWYDGFKESAQFHKMMNTGSMKTKSVDYSPAQLEMMFTAENMNTDIRYLANRFGIEGDQLKAVSRKYTESLKLGNEKLGEAQRKAFYASAFVAVSPAAFVGRNIITSMIRNAIIGSAGDIAARAAISAYNHQGSFLCNMAKEYANNMAEQMVYSAPYVVSGHIFSRLGGTIGQRAAVNMLKRGYSPVTARAAFAATSLATTITPGSLMGLGESVYHGIQMNAVANKLDQEAADAEALGQLDRAKILRERAASTRVQAQQAAAGAVTHVMQYAASARGAITQAYHSAQGRQLEARALIEKARGKNAQVPVGAEAQIAQTLASSIGQKNEDGQVIKLDPKSPEVQRWVNAVIDTHNGVAKELPKTAANYSVAVPKPSTPAERGRNLQDADAVNAGITSYQSLMLRQAREDMVAKLNPAAHFRPDSFVTPDKAKLRDNPDSLVGQYVSQIELSPDGKSINAVTGTVVGIEQGALEEGGKFRPTLLKIKVGKETKTMPLVNRNGDYALVHSALANKNIEVPSVLRVARKTGPLTPEAEGANEGTRAPGSVPPTKIAGSADEAVKVLSKKVGGDARGVAEEIRSSIKDKDAQNQALIVLSSLREDVLKNPQARANALAVIKKLGEDHTDLEFLSALSGKQLTGADGKPMAHEDLLDRVFANADFKDAMIEMHHFYKKGLKPERAVALLDSFDHEGLSGLHEVMNEAQLIAKKSNRTGALDAANKQRIIEEAILSLGKKRGFTDEKSKQIARAVLPCLDGAYQR